VSVRVAQRGSFQLGSAADCELLTTITPGVRGHVFAKCWLVAHRPAMDVPETDGFSMLTYSSICESLIHERVLLSLLLTREAHA